MLKLILFLISSVLLSGCNCNYQYQVLASITLFLVISSIVLLIMIWLDTRRAIKKESRNWPKGFSTNQEN